MSLLNDAMIDKLVLLEYVGTAIFHVSGEVKDIWKCFLLFVCHCYSIPEAKGMSQVKRAPAVMKLSVSILVTIENIRNLKQTKTDS